MDGWVVVDRWRGRIDDCDSLASLIVTEKYNNDRYVIL